MVFNHTDPTRRQIIDLLSNQSLNLNAVAWHFEISRPAISKHIKILMECGSGQIHPQTILGERLFRDKLYIKSS
ncbi:ArsR family transcriptional regulator [Pedobacter africanus]|uniref:ArsR family transcriptional regulator n=1 Tax=Pedobacter africanus TaxID=151894 RepID=UPI000A0180DC|nr:ArsR family transcriptional regulator [Pedobacter africanus]